MHFPEKSELRTKLNMIHNYIISYYNYMLIERKMKIITLRSLYYIPFICDCGTTPRIYYNLFFLYYIENYRTDHVFSLRIRGAKKLRKMPLHLDQEHGHDEMLLL